MQDTKRAAGVVEKTYIDPASKNLESDRGRQT